MITSSIGTQYPRQPLLLPVTPESASTGQPYTKPVRRKRLLWGLLAVVAVVLVLGVFKVFSITKALTGKGGFGGLGDVIKMRTDPRKFFPGKNRITVLVLGKDYNRDRKGMPYTKGSRSDTMMVMGIDLNTAKITAVSIPRDSKVTAADGVTDKFNSVIVRGGPQLVMDTLNNLFGVRPDYYVILKPDAVRSIVDELGGVDVEAIDDMNYDDSWGQLHIHIPKGKSHLNGEGAEGFVRFRKTTGHRSHPGVNLEEGDLRRGARQQQLIHAMVESAKSPSNLLHIERIINTGFRQIETNMSQTQLLALGSFFQEAGGAQIEGGALPGEDSPPGSPVYYWLLDQNRSMKMMQWLINGDQVAGQSLPRVAVYNSSNASNAARAIASTLYADGYEAFNGGGRAPLAPTSSVTFRLALYESQAQQIATVLGTGPAVKEPGNPADTWSPEIHVTVGTDLAAKFAAAGTAPSAVSTSPTRSSRRHKGKKSSSASNPPPAPEVEVQSQAGGR
jgi:LCP family protein required for cell wall assembly